MVARADILDSGFGLGGLRDSSFHFVPFGMTCSFEVGGCELSGGCAAAELTTFLPESAVISTEGELSEALSPKVNLLFNSQIVMDSGYSYDNLRRLTFYGNFQNVSYSTMGNITHKTDAGNFKYEVTNRPFLLTEQTNIPDDYDLDMPTAFYTSGGRVDTITKSDISATFLYNHVGERTKMTVTGSAFKFHSFG